MTRFPPKWNQVRERLGNGLLLTLLLGIFLRFYKLGHPQLWLDEIIQLVRFSHRTLWENLVDIHTDIAAVPLDYMVQQLFVMLWGTSEFSARFHAAIFGSLSLLCIYWIGKSILSHRAARFAVLALAVYPLHRFYSQEGRGYSLFFFLTLCTYGLFSKALKTGKISWWILFGLATLANFYSNYFAGLVVFTQGIFVLSLATRPVGDSAAAFGGRLSSRNLVFFCSVTLLALLLFLPWLLWTYSYAHSQHVTPFSVPGLSLLIFKELSGGGYPLSLLLLLLFAMGVASLWRQRQWAVAALLVLWFLLPIPIVLLLDSLQGYVFATRQILFTTPGLVLGVANGLSELPEIVNQPLKGRYLQVASMILLVVLGIGSMVLSDKKEQADWKGLSRYLETHAKGADLIAAPHIERIVAFGYPQIASRRISLESLRAQVSLGKPRRVHLIESRYVTPAHKRTVTEILAFVPPSESTDLQGFRVYTLNFPAGDFH